MNLRDITLMLGVDRVTVEQLKLSHQTWKKFHPELWDIPWVVFFDDRYGRELVLEIKKINPWAVVHAWSCDGYPSQRAAMLTGFVMLPPVYVKSPWWMKIDCDAIALNSDTPLIEDEWFEPKVIEGLATPGYNVMVANPWGYTKPKGDDGDPKLWCDRLEIWGDTIFGDCTRLDLAKHISGNKIRYPRIASWFSLYNTDFSWAVMRACGDQLPVPSQDTVHWYYAQRNCSLIERVKFKRRGWNNIPRMRNLEQQVNELV